MLLRSSCPRPMTRAAHRGGPAVAIRLAKRALYHNLETDLRGGLEFETFAAEHLLRDRGRARGHRPSWRSARRVQGEIGMIELTLAMAERRGGGAARRRTRQWGARRWSSRDDGDRGGNEARRLVSPRGGRHQLPEPGDLAGQATAPPTSAPPPRRLAGARAEGSVFFATVASVLPGVLRRWRHPHRVRASHRGIGCGGGTGEQDRNAPRGRGRADMIASPRPQWEPQPKARRPSRDRGEADYVAWRAAARSGPPQPKRGRPSRDRGDADTWLGEPQPAVGAAAEGEATIQRSRRADT